MHAVEKMAYVGAVPWHGLGNRLTPGLSIEEWQLQAGMQWKVIEAPVHFRKHGDGDRNIEGFKVLFRDDNDFPLSIVTNRYRVVQPAEVLEFFRDLVQAGGFELETAGVLHFGRKIWALAKTGREAILRGDDRLKSYLLLATSTDGSMSTTAMFTSIRVVCRNTLALANASGAEAVRVPHLSTFDPLAVKLELGLHLSKWDTFISDIKSLADRKVTPEEAKRYLVTVLGEEDQPFEEQPRAVKKAFELFNGAGVGADLEAANGSCWGLVNSVTEYIDHLRTTRTPDSRLSSAWFGTGAVTKQRAFEEALKLAA